jgi:hypothetical protein
MKESSDPIYQEIYKRVRENPELLVSPSSEFVELLLSKPNQVLIMVFQFHLNSQFIYLQLIS